jgi:hypothetical protein
MVGFGGETYVRGLKSGPNRIDVSWAGGQCSVTFKAGAELGRLPKLGPLTCAR